MKLKLGIMTNEELAEWFGCKIGQFKNTKTKKLSILKQYCDFYEVKGKVYITDIFFDTYEGKNFARTQQLEEDFLEVLQPYDTCTRIGEVINERHDDWGLQTQTTIRLVRNTKIDLFGKSNGAPGKIGSCKSVLCKLGPDKIPTPLTEEERILISDLKKKHFSPDEMIDKTRAITSLEKEGKITKEKAYDMLIGINEDDGESEFDLDYADFLTAARIALGCKLVTATLFIRDDEDVLMFRAADTLQAGS